MLQPQIVEDTDTPRDVVLMMRTKDFRDLNTLRGDLTVAGERAKCRWPEGGLTLEAIDSDSWRKLRTAFGGGTNEDDLANEFELSSGTGVELMATNKRNYYQVRVAPDRQLTGADLSYRLTDQDDGEIKTTKLVPGKKTDDPESNPLRYDGIGGHYSLSLPPNWQPQSISIQLDDNKPSVEYQWPQSSLVLGRIEDFQGSIRKMFDALKDRELMGVPVQGFEQSVNMTVVAADFVRDFAKITYDWVSDTKLRIRVPYNQEVPSNRIWFLFPLDDASMDEGKSVISDRLPKGDYDLSIGLRSSDHPYPIVSEADPATLDALGDPQFLHLPLILDERGAPKYFERTFDVPDRKAVEDRYHDEIKALYLYEKDMRSKEFPHRIVPIQGDQGLQHVLEQTMRGWKKRTP